MEGRRPVPKPRRLTIALTAQSGEGERPSKQREQQKENSIIREEEEQDKNEEKGGEGAKEPVGQPPLKKTFRNGTALTGGQQAQRRRLASGGRQEGEEGNGSQRAAGANQQTGCRRIRVPQPVAQQQPGANGSKSTATTGTGRPAATLPRKVPSSNHHQQHSHINSSPLLSSSAISSRSGTIINKPPPSSKQTAAVSLAFSSSSSANKTTTTFPATTTLPFAQSWPVTIGPPRTTISSCSVSSGGNKRWHKDRLLDELAEQGGPEERLIASWLGNGGGGGDGNSCCWEGEGECRPRFSLDRLLPPELVPPSQEDDRCVQAEFSLRRPSPRGRCQGTVWQHWQTEKGQLAVAGMDQQQQRADELGGGRRKEPKTKGMLPGAVPLSSSATKSSAAHSAAVDILSPSPRRAGISLLEQLVKSHPIWFLPHLNRQAVAHLLRNQPPGVFIVRGSSRAAPAPDRQNQPSVPPSATSAAAPAGISSLLPRRSAGAHPFALMALSMRLPSPPEGGGCGGEQLDHFVLEPVGSGQSVRLEGSPNSFGSLPLLLEHYSRHGEELKCRLALPEAVAHCESMQKLQGIALMGQDFWTSALSSCVSSSPSSSPSSCANSGRSQCHSPGHSSLRSAPLVFYNPMSTFTDNGQQQQSSGGGCQSPCPSSVTAASVPQFEIKGGGPPSCLCGPCPAHPHVSLRKSQSVQSSMAVPGSCGSRFGWCPSPGSQSLREGRHWPRRQHSQQNFLRNLFSPSPSRRQGKEAAEWENGGNGNCGPLWEEESAENNEMDSWAKERQKQKEGGRRPSLPAKSGGGGPASLFARLKGNFQRRTSSSGLPSRAKDDLAGSRHKDSNQDLHWAKQAAFRRTNTDLTGAGMAAALDRMRHFQAAPIPHAQLASGSRTGQAAVPQMARVLPQPRGAQRQLVANGGPNSCCRPNPPPAGIHLHRRAPTNNGYLGSSSCWANSSLASANLPQRMLQQQQTMLPSFPHHPPPLEQLAPPPAVLRQAERAESMRNNGGGWTRRRTNGAGPGAAQKEQQMERQQQQTGGRRPGQQQQIRTQAVATVRPQPKMSSSSQRPTQMANLPPAGAESEYTHLCELRPADEAAECSRGKAVGGCEDSVSVAGTDFNEPWDSNAWENLLELARFGDGRVSLNCTRPSRHSCCSSASSSSTWRNSTSGDSPAGSAKGGGEGRTKQQNNGSSPTGDESGEDEISVTEEAMAMAVVLAGNGTLAGRRKPTHCQRTEEEEDINGETPTNASLDTLILMEEAAKAANCCRASGGKDHQRQRRIRGTASLLDISPTTASEGEDKTMIMIEESANAMERQKREMMMMDAENNNNGVGRSGEEAELRTMNSFDDLNFRRHQGNKNMPINVNIHPDAHSSHHRRSDLRIQAMFDKSIHHQQRDNNRERGPEQSQSRESLIPFAMTKEKDANNNKEEKGEGKQQNGQQMRGNNAFHAHVGIGTDKLASNSTTTTETFNFLKSCSSHLVTDRCHGQDQHPLNAQNLPGAGMPPCSPSLDELSHHSRSASICPSITPVMSPSRLRNASFENAGEEDPARVIQRYVESLSMDDQTTFGATLQRFVECTLLSREQDPYVVVRRVRQFLNGMKNYLEKNGEADLHAIIQRESGRLHADEFLNIDAILEAVLNKILLVRIKAQLYRLMILEITKNGELGKLSENLTHVRTMSAVDLGFSEGTPMPDSTRMELISKQLRKMQSHYSPLRKLQLLLRALSLAVPHLPLPSASGSQPHQQQSAVSNGPGPTPCNSAATNNNNTVARQRSQSGSSLIATTATAVLKHPPAEELIRWLVYMLARSSTINCEIEAWYMWELLPQQVLSTGDAAYFLSILFSAVHVLKHPDSIRKLKQISLPNVASGVSQLANISDFLGSQSTLHEAEDAQDLLLRVAIPNEQEGTIEYHTFPVLPKMNVAKFCRVIAHQFSVSIPEDYGLYVLFDGYETCLSPSEFPHLVRDQLLQSAKPHLFAYKRSEARLAWPRQAVSSCSTVGSGGGMGLGSVCAGERR